MSETTLWIIESLVFGAVFGGIIIMAVWKWDIRDREKMHEQKQLAAYAEGYEDGARFRFRHMCRVERRCRELEEQIQEIQDDSTTQM